MSQKPTKKPIANTPAGAPASSPMNLGMLEQLVKLMSENDLNTVDLREGANRVILKRGAAYSPAPAAPPAASRAPAPLAGEVAGGGTKAAAADPDAGLVPITSPMVGTFYASPGPDQKAFVQVGSVVSDETDVCIVEAMKVMNHCQAGVKGTIVRIVAQNGKAVEFGQTLFLVMP